MAGVSAVPDDRSGSAHDGQLADWLGARHVYLAGLVLVSCGGLLGYLAPRLGLLVTARVLMGRGTSAAYPAAMTLVRRQSERLGRPARGGVLGTLAITGQVGMAIGPPLGGLLIAVGGWPPVFLVTPPLAALGAAIAMAWLPRDEPHADTVHTDADAGTGTTAGGMGRLWHCLDVTGLRLFAGALISLLLFLMRLSSPRWELLGLAVTALAVLIGWEYHTRTPFIDVRMLTRNWALTATYLRYAVTFFVTYCFIYGWTQWLEQSARRSASGAGLLLVPSFVVAITVSVLGSRGRGVLGPLLIGTTALAAGSACLLFLHADTRVYVLIGVMYQNQATDVGLHNLGIVLTAASLLLVATGASLSLRGDRPSPVAHRHIHIHSYHDMHLLELATHSRTHHRGRQ